MARKDYEMAFMLSAHLNSTFQTQFNAAQATMKNLQNEIDKVNKTQRDISAYEKQKSAVDATREKLEKLQQEYEQLDAIKAKDNVIDTDALAKMAAKQIQIDKTSASLEGQEQKLGQLGQKLKESGVDLDNMGESSKKLEAQVKDLKDQQDKAAESAQDFGKQGADAMKALNDAIVDLGLIDVLKEAREAFMQCVDTAASFEETLSTVEALSGASSSEMGELSEKAKQLGAATQYTAQESAEAMTYMAMAGWDTQDMLSGMSGVIDLAAASGEDLAEVSDIVTDALTAFGLTASDTAHFADVLAMTATKSNTSVGLMGETFKYAAPLAGALGYSVEDVATLIGLMANSGIKASQSGTALRTMFTKLTDGATLTAGAFGEYTVETQNADGTMRTLNEVIADLRDRFAEMTDAEKIANAEALVGDRAMSGFVALMNSTQDDFDSLASSIDNCSGAAAEMSQIKLDNMNGQLKLAQSAWEGVTIAVGEQFTPAMSKAYEAAAGVFSWLKGFIEENPALVKAIAAFVAAMGLGTAGIAAYSVAVKLATAATGLFSASLLGIPVVGIVAGLAALTAGAVALTSAMGGSRREYDTWTYAAREQYDELQELNGEYRQACDTQGEMSEEALRLRYQIDSLSGSLEENRQTMEGFLAECDEVIDSCAQMADEYHDSTASLRSNETGTMALIQRLEDLAESTDDTAGKQHEMEAIIEELNASVDGLSLSYGDLISNQEGAISSLRAYAEAQAKQEQMQEQYDAYVESVKAESAAQEQLLEVRSELAAAQEAYGKANKEYSDYASQALKNDVAGTAALTLAFSPYAKALGAASDDVDALAARESELNDAISEQKKIQQECEEAWGDAAGAADAALELEEAGLGDRIEETTGQMDALAEAYREAYDAALESVGGQYSLWDEAAKKASTSVTDINKAMESQIDYWKDYNDNLAALAGAEDEISGLSDLIASFADGSEESVNAVAGMAEALKGGDTDALKEMVGNYQELQKEQEETADSLAEMKTGYTEEMDALTEELADDVAAMDLSAEAEASGAATMQGYIDGITGKEGAMDAALRKLTGKMNTVLNLSGQSRISMGATGGGYASGTESAEPGVRLVGERGPELMLFGGGEKVLSAARTKEVLTDAAPAGQASGASASVTYAPTLNLSGTSVTEQEARSALADAQEMFERWLEERTRQQGRLSFA